MNGSVCVSVCPSSRIMSGLSFFFNFFFFFFFFFAYCQRGLALSFFFNIFFYPCVKGAWHLVFFQLFFFFFFQRLCDRGSRHLVFTLRRGEYMNGSVRLCVC